MTNLLTFDIDSAYYKLYESSGDKEVNLTAHEADELLDYIQYVGWMLNPPEGDWCEYLKLRRAELCLHRYQKAKQKAWR